MGTRGWLTRATIEQGWSLKTRIWAAMLALLALGLCRLPLVGVLGFEFALVLAIVGSVMGADLGASLVWRARRHSAPPALRGASPELVVLGLWAGATSLCALLLLPPLIIVSLAAFWVRNCDWLFGLRCALLMPMLSVAIASGLGVLSALVAGPRRRLHLTLPFALLVVSVLVSLAHFYSAPAVFSYNPFAGYMPGNIYDESIDLRAPFYWARLYHLSVLVAVGAVVCLGLDLRHLQVRRKAKPRTRRLAALVTALLAGAAALSLHWHSAALGFSVSTSDVQEALPGRYESEHFIIHYSADPQIADNIESIADDHEFRRAQLVRDFDVDPPGKIHSYYFANIEQKHQLMGARNVYMAKPWRHEIYMNYQQFPHSVLRHEIAHVMAGAFGDAIFEVSAGRLLGLPVFFNVGLIEGTAVAADWPDHFDKALTPHQSVKAMQELDMAPPAKRLFSTGFLAFSSARSYTLAGSYLRFLIDRYGMARLRQLYQNGGDFGAVYGRSPSTLTQEWRALIEATILPDGAAEIVRERFRRPAIFERPCPHAIARARVRMLKEAASGDYASAIRTARSVCHDVPEEPKYRLLLAAMLARGGELEEAAAIYDDIAGNGEPISSSLRAHALFKRVEISMAADKREEALGILKQIASMPVSDDARRHAQVSLTILQHQGPAGLALRSIFWGAKPGREIDRLRLVGLAAEAAAAEPTLGLTHYLVSRQLRGRGDPSATRRALLRALRGNLHPLVQREAARMLAESSYLAQAYDDVLRAAEILVQAEQPEVTRLLGYDWYERVQWAKTGSVPAEPLGWRDGVTQSGAPR